MMMTMTKRGAISYDKLRSHIGLVGIEIRSGDKNIYIKFIRQWRPDQINQLASDVAQLHEEFQWGDTYIEQESGEYLISMLKKEYNLPVKVISTQKKVKDPNDIERIKTMDKIEMTEFLRKLKLNGQLRFPKKPSPRMKQMEGQIEMFAKHTTEAGGIDYYAPGEEPDDLVKSLMIACFSVRNIIGISTSDIITHVGGGIGADVLRRQFPSFDSETFNQDIEKWWEP